METVALPPEALLSDLTQHTFFCVGKTPYDDDFSTSHMYFERINAACWHLHMFKYIEHSFTSKWLSAVYQF